MTYNNSADVPLVSIICLTFNHEKYIRQCLDSLVKQKTSFPFEIIVHDDASTDGTAEIVHEFAQKYPKLIRPLLQTENQHSKGLSIISTFIHPIVRGKIIARCEGDDFWTDPYKLEKQVHVLAEHPDCRLCLHKVEGVSESGDRLGIWFPKDAITTGTIDQAEFVEKNNDFFQLTSYCYYFEDELKYYAESPEFYRISDVGDKPLLMFLGTCGNAFYIDEAMSCYRQNSKASWTTNLTAGAKEKSAEHLRASIKAWEAFDRYTKEKYHETIANNIRTIQFRIETISFPYRGVFKRQFRDLRAALPITDRIKIILKAAFPRAIPKIAEKYRSKMVNDR